MIIYLTGAAATNQGVGSVACIDYGRKILLRFRIIDGDKGDKEKEILFDQFVEIMESGQKDIVETRLFEQFGANVIQFARDFLTKTHH